MKKSLLIISTTNQDRDPRVIRQINFLKDEYELWCCGLENSRVPKDRFLPITINKSVLSRIPVLILRLFRAYRMLENYITRYKLKIDCPSVKFDFILANDLDSLPIAFKLFKSKNIYCDFHEYAPAEFEDKFSWRLLHRGFAIHQCKRYFPLLKNITTVCEGIATEYQKHFNRKPVVITNAATYSNLQPMKPAGSKIRLIHHGVAIRSRRIELMIGVAKMLDDGFSLDLMLIPNDEKYFDELKLQTENSGKINMIEPVSFNQIIPFSNKYDAGIFILPFTNFNYKFALPNKFFEFIQSRLAIITGPSPEMADFINRYKLGYVTKSFKPSEIAKEINSITNEQIIQWKANSHNSARVLASEANKTILLNLFKEI